MEKTGNKINLQAGYIYVQNLEWGGSLDFRLDFKDAVPLAWRNSVQEIFFTVFNEIANVERIETI